MLSHSTTQIPFFCNNLYTNRFRFSIQMQRFYFHKKRAKTNKDILQILNIVENQCIRKCHVTVNVRQYYHINRSEKPVTHTRENPHPWMWVGVSTGTGTGWPGIPQGYQCYSLPQLNLNLTRVGVRVGVQCLNAFFIHDISTSTHTSTLPAGVA